MYSSFIFNYFQSGLRIGLFEGEKYGPALFVIFDVLVILTILIHTFILTTLGLNEENEEDVESISEAIGRFVKTLL